MNKEEKRKERREGKRWCRSYKYNEHHLLRAKSLGGSSDPENLVTLDVSRHDAYHFLFGNLTLDEVIEMLIRLKRYQKSRKGKVKHRRTKQ